MRHQQCGDSYGTSSTRALSHVTTTACHADNHFLLLTSRPSRQKPDEPTSVMPAATSALQASLEEHNKAFETLLSLIPPKYYVVRDDNNDQVRFHCLAPRAY